MATRTDETPTQLMVRTRRTTLTNGDTSKLRIVLLGSGKVGKSALVWRLLNDLFVCQYIPTIEDSYRYLAQLPDGRFKSVEILDTSGTHQFPAMRDLSIKSGQAFIVVYSIESRQSFDEAIGLLDLIQFIKCSALGSCVPIALVGNKLDLDSDNRVVSSEEASLAAGARGCALFAEMSAMTTGLGRKVDELIGELLVPLMPSDKPTRGTSVRGTRGPISNRKRIGRSQSAAVFSTGSALIRTPVGDPLLEDDANVNGTNRLVSVIARSKTELLLAGEDTGPMQSTRCTVL